MFFIFEFKIIKTVRENLNLKLRLSNMDLDLAAARLGPTRSQTVTPECKRSTDKHAECLVVVNHRA